MNIEAVIIDSREPDWIKKLTFGSIPVSVAMLDTGDIQAVCSDGCLLLVERKTPSDFLNSLHDERLFPQLARLVEPRFEQQLANSQVTTWPYLVITGEFQRGSNGKVITGDRGETGWSWDSVQGALITIQEMGVFVVFCAGDVDFENCVIRLGQRKREPIIRLLPPRMPQILGPGAAFLASLPGIGPERVLELLKFGGTPAQTLTGIVDLDIKIPGLPDGVRKRIRQVLGLRDKWQLDIAINESGNETIDIFEKVEA